MKLYRSLKQKKVCVVVVMLLLVIGCSSFQVSFVDPEIINEHRLLMCGPNSFCDVTKAHSLNWTANMDSKTICPPCFCDNGCFHRKNCCPDKFFGSPHHSCVNVTLIEAMSDQGRKEHSEYLMITSCPENSENSLKESCEGRESISFRLQHPPVTSKTSGLSYFNQFCALCNHDRYFEIWNLDIKCKILTDFNFLSSFEEIVQLAFDNGCIFQSFPTFEVEVYNCFQHKIVYFDRCNKTGLWKNFDHNVKTLCESGFWESDNFFKNTFCRLCNPSVRVVPLVSSCNATGLWKPHSDEILKACHQLPESLATFPYKNVFCYMCNKNNLDYAYHFHDVQSVFTVQHVLSVPDEKELFEYHFENKDINIEYFDSIIKKGEDQEGNLQWSNHSVDIFSASSHKINISALIHQKIAFTDTINICDENIIPESFAEGKRDCDCNPSCLYSSDDQLCCDDLVLKYPANCERYSTLLGSKSKAEKETEYLLTDGCFEQSKYPEIIGRGCKYERNNMLSLLPVSDLLSNILYRNFYCLACNKVDWTEKSPIPINDPWDVTIVCEDFLEYDYYLLFGDILKTLTEMECNVTYNVIPKDKKKRNINLEFSPKKCILKTDYEYLRCNITEKWATFNEDLKWACEDQNKGTTLLGNGYFDYFKGTFKNTYCLLCNPDGKDGEQITDECKSETFKSSFYYETFCKYFPSVPNIYPYKNIGCLKCNGNEVVRVDSHTTARDHDEMIATKKPEKPWYPVFRKLFSVNSDEDYVIPETGSSQCSALQKFDVFTGTCRNISCYPGKIKRGTSCLALLQHTANLRYRLSFNLLGTSDTKPFLKFFTVAVRDMLGEEFMNRLSLNFDPVLEMKIQLNQSCELIALKDAEAIPYAMEGKMDLTLFIKESVSRIKTEENLLAFTNHSVKVRVKKTTMNLFLKRNELTLPYFDVKDDIKCTEHFSDKPDIPYEYNRLVTVSKVLLCPQIEINADEYQIDSSSLSLVILTTNHKYNVSKYDILPNGTARICLEDFLAGSLSASRFSTSSKQYALWITTLTCSVTSLVFLCLALLTYCVFPVLRTTPGKNNMAIITSLFVTQALFQISNTGSPSDIICKIFGVALHYSWLVLFFYLSVASFHMFRLFHPKLAIKHHVSHDNTFLKYSIISLSMPVGIVLIRITISLFTSTGSDMGYGMTKCFIDGALYNFLFFILPIGLICILNIIFFTSTAWNISRRSRIKSNRNKGSDFSAICRLFTVTGIALVLQILDGFLPFSLFSFVASVVTSLQGMFIFIAFFCTRSTLNLVKSACAKTALVKTFSSKEGRYKDTTDTDCSVTIT